MNKLSITIVSVKAKKTQVTRWDVNFAFKTDRFINFLKSSAGSSIKAFSIRNIKL